MHLINPNLFVVSGGPGAAFSNARVKMLMCAYCVRILICFVICLVVQDSPEFLAEITTHRRSASGECHE